MVTLNSLTSSLARTFKSGTRFAIRFHSYALCSSLSHRALSKNTTKTKAHFLPSLPFKSRHMATGAVKGVTAGLIVIGDEILKGQTQDTNTFFISQKLHSYGITLKRVSTISDDVQVIANEVKEFSEKFKIVITTGGIGPTHDDVTFEGVAEAFDDRLEFHPKIVKFVQEWFKTDDPDSPALKLALIPSKSELHFGLDKVSGKEVRYPVITIENVFILPGIPDLLRRIFVNFGNELFGHLSSDMFYVRECFIAEFETDIADRLNKLVRQYPQVTFGSYPEWINNYYKTKITIETGNEELANLVEEQVKQDFPIVSYDKNPIDNAMEKLERLISKTEAEDEHFRECLAEAKDTIQKCLESYKADEIIACFNGGKDCIVMLHILHTYFKRKYPSEKLQAIYIKEKDPFPEVESFILKSEAAYDLEALNYEGEMKQSLQRMLDERPHIKAAVMGTRKGDPGSHWQDLFSPTDGDWPKVMRVNPILNWEYKHVWKFVRGLSLPYPILYDKGFTSLGSTKNTERNETLKYVDVDGKVHYKPAHELRDGATERNGRH